MIEFENISVIQFNFPLLADLFVNYFWFFVPSLYILGSNPLSDVLSMYGIFYLIQ